MRILRLRLVNNKRLHNGLHRDSIDIDLRNNPFKQVIILGSNGSGKSTILSALSPLPPDGKDFIDGTNGIKLIEFECNEEFLRIIYTSQVDPRGIRKPMKCSILSANNPNFDNAIELNPNMNMTSAKDIIYDHLALDSNFEALSIFSTAKKGLVDMTSTERLKYVNAILSSVDAYNEIYKGLSKKYNVYKAQYNTVKSKMDVLGNAEVIKRQIEKDRNITKDAKAKLQESEEELRHILNKRDQLKSVLDSDLNVDMMKKYKMSLDDIKTQICNQFNVLSKADKSYHIDIDNIDIDTQILNEAKRYVSSYISIDSDISNLSTISDLVFALDVFRNQLNKESEALSDNIMNTMDSIAKIQAQINQCLEAKTKYEELSKAKSDNELKLQSLNNFKDPLDANIDDRIGSVASLSYKLPEDTKSLIAEGLQRMKEDTHKAFAQAVKDINIDTTAIKDFIFSGTHILKQSLVEEKEVIQKAVDIVSKYSKDLSSAGADVSDCIDSYDLVSNLYTSISPNTAKVINQVCDKDHMWDIILGANGRNKASELMYTLTQIIEKNHEYQSIKSNIDTLNQSIYNLHYNEKNTEELESELQKLRETEYRLKCKETEITQKMTKMNNPIDIIRFLNSIRDILDRYRKVKEPYERMYNIYKTQTQAYEDYNNLINNPRTKEVQNEISKYKEMIEKSVEIIAKLNFNLTLLKDYKNDLEDYNKNISLIDILRKYSSSSTGIQTIFIHMYMNQILVIANQALQSFFNGNITIDRFNIDSKNFSISCSTKDGLPIDDISSMSNSQRSIISAIISAAILRKSSSNYDILRLDEIDGPLDPANRIAFAQQLSKLLEVFGIEQCFIVSLNQEINYSDKGIILLGEPLTSVPMENVITQL